MPFLLVCDIIGMFDARKRSGRLRYGVTAETRVPLLYAYKGAACDRKYLSRLAHFFAPIYGPPCPP